MITDPSQKWLSPEQKAEILYKKRMATVSFYLWYVCNMKMPVESEGWFGSLMYEYLMYNI
jgi:hypothetical protein